MAESIVCPNCQRKLQIPEQFLGQRVQCPECRHEFVAPNTSISTQPVIPAPPPTESYREEPGESRRPRHERDDDLDDDEDLDVRRLRQTTGPRPHNYMTESILVTLCCCVPFGIVAIINAAKVGTHLSNGDYELAVRSSEEAKKWCWIGAILGLIVNAAYFLFQITAGHQGF